MRCHQQIMFFHPLNRKNDFRWFASAVAALPAFENIAICHGSHELPCIGILCINDCKTSSNGCLNIFEYANNCGIPQPEMTKKPLIDSC